VALQNSIPKMWGERGSLWKTRWLEDQHLGEDRPIAYVRRTLVLIFDAYDLGNLFEVHLDQTFGDQSVNLPRPLRLTGNPSGPYRADRCGE
jgi:hypothetical protein